MNPNTVYASHYRGGTLSYSKGTGLKVTFTLEAFFRRGFGGWCPKAPATCVGKTVTGLKDLFYGDGKKIAVTAKVVADDIKNDIVTLKQTFVYTYAKAGNYNAYWSGCCWVTNASKTSNWTLRTVVQAGNPNRNPVINSPTLFPWCANIPFSANLNASDPDKDPLTYKVEYGPTAMKVDTRGNITWAAPGKGLWPVGIQITDSKGASTHRQFMLNVQDPCPNNLPALTLTPDKATIKPGQKACTNVAATDKDTTDKLTWVVSAPATGTSTGVPTSPQAHPSKFQYCWTSTLKDEGQTRTILLTVKDSGNPELYAQKTFTVSVGKGVAPTLILTPKVTTVTLKEGTTWSVTASASDPDGNGIASLTIAGVPAFCTQKAKGATTILVTCKPGYNDGGKKATLIFNTTDKDGIPKTASSTVALSVSNVNRAPKLVFAPTAPKVQESNSLTVTATASDDDGDKVTLTTSTLPKGMLWNLSGNVGTINWTPGTTQAGVYKLTVTVTDSGQPSLKVSKVLTITVTNLNLPPSITSTAPLTATEDKLYRYAAKASDPDTGDKLTWSLGQAPAGVKIDANTGVLTWTPGDKEAGKKTTLSILVCDNGKQCAQQKWVVTVTNVNDTPKITSKPSTSVNEKTAWSYNPTAVDPDPNESLSWSLTAKPSGASVDPKTGRITWQAGAPGKDEAFVLKVCDKSGACDTQSWKVTVKDVNEAPRITSTPPVAADENKPYVYNPKATDADAVDQGKLTWKLLKGPQKASFDTKSGRLTWTPDAQDVRVGSEVFSIQVCDTRGACDTQTWTVKVNNVNDAPTITSKAPIVAYVGQRYRYVPTANDPDGDKLSWTLKKGPAGVQFDTNSGSITWTPAQADASKQIDIVIEVCDNGQPPRCTSQTLNILVRQKCFYDVDCPKNEICIEELGERLCNAPACDATTPCAKGKICRNGQCLTTDCMSKGCNAGEICRATDGKCIKACKGVTCKTGEFCKDGSCSKDPCAGKCKAGEVCDTRQQGKPACLANPCSSGSCKAGRICPGRTIGPCVDDPCLSMTCPKADQRCLAGQCVERPPCVVDVDCPNAQVCLQGRCALAGCYAPKASCKNGELCQGASCKSDPCASATCQANEFCRPSDGKCVKPCAGITCKPGEFCDNGSCVKEPCAGVTCKAGQTCFLGKCEYTRCNASNVCRYGRTCDNRSNRCLDDPCAGVKCPDSRQICAGGQCLSPGSCVFDKDCPNAQLCLKGKCLTPSCVDTKDCKTGELCENGACVEAPCAGKKCEDGRFCRLGQCIRTCAGIFCKKGELCIDGKCLADACDGLTCKSGERCINGRCVEDNCEKDSCKSNRACRPKGCVTAPCSGVVCGKDQSCRDGVCTGLRFCTVDKDCPGAGVCIKGRCAESGCYDGGCKDGELCVDGKCQSNGCLNETCNDGFYCRPSDKQCVRTCPVCEKGKRCINGFCETDPCADVTCKDGERCVEGACKPDRCLQSATPLCKSGRVCNDSQCGDDLCNGVKCPGGRACRDGVCTRAPDVAEEPDSEPVTDAGNKESGGSKEKLAEIPTLPPGGGCDCSQATLPLSLAWWLLLLPLFWRRRNR